MCTRKPYPTDVSDDEGAFVAPYLSILPQDAKHSRHDLRELFNARRWLVRAGAPWRLLPAFRNNDFRHVRPNGQSSRARKPKPTREADAVLA
jgi:transposase